MSAIDEGIVREYFEQNGFLVRQPRKYQVVARRKTGDEEVMSYDDYWALLDHLKQMACRHWMV